MLQVVRLYAAVGSPPHMRGKVLPNAVQLKKSGITPAYAGKRGLRKRGSRNPADHPRICGEKWDKLPSENKQKGSPPRMRGKGHRIPLRHPLQGITPAYAGKSSACRRTLSAGWDHPRICGEKIVVSRTWCSRSGLPPRMWGKVSSIRDDLARVGITPAYAGKSSSPRLIALLIWDHPRICGAKYPTAVLDSPYRGSPRICGEKA